MPNPILVLIDGHSLAFRAYHALPMEMAAPSGELTNAVFGFAQMLLNVLRDRQPEYVVVAFDVGRTFRHDMYGDYKGHRERTPHELETQVERIQQVLGALNIPVVTREGYEADDVLSTLARQAEAQGVNSLIVTGDRDILQIVDAHITVLTSGRRFSDIILYTPEAVQERYGLLPEQLVDYKALIGDKSDNIPGVRGVGEKGATALLQKYGTLEELYAHLDEVTPERTKRALEEGRADAELSHQLGQIITDVPIKLDLSAARRRGYDRERVIALFQDLAFRSLVERLPEAGEQAGHKTEPGPAAPHPTGEAGPSEAGPSGASPNGAAGAGGEEQPGEQMALFTSEEVGPSEARTAPETTAAGENPYLVVTDEATLGQIAARLAAAPMIAFDTESTGIDPHSADIVGLAVAWDRTPDSAAYIPLRHPDANLLSWDVVRAALQPVFRDERIAKVAHNASYDLSMIARHGLEVRGKLVDTMIAEWLIDPGSRTLGLKDLAWTRLHVEMTPITQLIGKGKNQITMDLVPVAQAAPYAAADAAMTLRLADVVLPELPERGLTFLFEQVEMPLVPVLAGMEAAGIRVDVPYLKRMSVELTARLQQLERQICEIAGYVFNINSTQQLSDVLFGKLALPAEGLKKTQAGNFSTAADVLEGLRGKHEIVDLILEQRQLSKLLGTYVDALPALVNPRTGRIHTSFNQTGAETGRVSSNTPNLQNIPIRSDVGREIRRAFVADEGNLLLSADYSQVELRILAHISGDKNLLAAFARGEDIHTSAAAAVYGVSLSQVTKQQRSVAKMMNFATAYGVSAYGLSQQSGLSRGDAEAFMARYFETYPGIRDYLSNTKGFAYEHGYVETLLGRRRYFPVLKTTGSGQRAYVARQAAERAAINHPVQGTAADIIKIAMPQLYNALRDGGYQARMLLQVHDELVLEVPQGELAAVARLTCQIMEGAYDLRAPLRVDLEGGPNWCDLEPIGS
jgi:DNA polymerase I